MLLKNYYKWTILRPGPNAKWTDKADGTTLVRTDGKECYIARGYGGALDNLFWAVQYAPCALRVMTTLLTVHSNSSAPNSSTGSGIVFGNGTKEVSFDDYALSGDIFTTFTETSAYTISHDVDGLTVTTTATLTNTGTSDFTVSEVGLYGWHTAYTNQTTTSNSVCRFMVERTLLDTPVTIPAGGIGQVTYTIRMNYPTA